MFYEARAKFIKLSGDYFTIPSGAKYKIIYEKGIKILTRKQMLQKFLIALAQVKAGNTSENLLKEICQIIYSLYHYIYDNNIQSLIIVLNI